MIYTETSAPFEAQLTTLSPQIRERMAVYGSYLLLTEVESRLALAKERLAFFQKMYGISLADLNEKGLPENADWKMHEDYVEWSGWQVSYGEARETIDALRGIVDTANVIPFAR